MRARRDWGGWPSLAMIVALLLCLAPATVMGQGIKDAVDDPATEEGTDEPFDPADEPSSSDWEAAGLIDDQSYESPQFGYTVDWSRDWAVDVYYDQPEEDLQPVMSDERNQQDIIYLVWSGGPNQEAYVIFAGFPSKRGGPAGDVEEWTDPDYIERQWDTNNMEVEVLLEETTRDAGAVLYSVVDTEDPGGLVYYTIYQSIELEDGTTLYLTFSAGEDWFEDAYESWVSDLEVDGAPIDVVFEWEEIEAAI